MDALGLAVDVGLSKDNGPLSMNSPVRYPVLLSERRGSIYDKLVLRGVICCGCFHFNGVVSWCFLGVKRPFREFLKDIRVFNAYLGTFKGYSGFSSHKTMKNNRGGNRKSLRQGAPYPSSVSEKQPMTLMSSMP